MQRRTDRLATGSSKLVTVAVTALLAAGCVAGGSASGEPGAEEPFNDVAGETIDVAAGVRAFVPDGWLQADTAPTAERRTPFGFMTVATVEIVSGGDDCPGALPEATLASLGSEDALVWLGEPRAPRESDVVVGAIDALPSDVPTAWEPCVADERERLDLGFLGVAVDGLGFDVLVATGAAAGQDLRRAAQAVVRSMERTGDAADDVLRVHCDADGDVTLENPVVQVQADGLHLRVTREAGTAAEVVSLDGNVGAVVVFDGVEGTRTWSRSGPGWATVWCGEPGWTREPPVRATDQRPVVLVVDEKGHWIEGGLSCATREAMGATHVGGAIDATWDDDVLTAAATFLDDQVGVRETLRSVGYVDRPLAIEVMSPEGRAVERWELSEIGPLGEGERDDGRLFLRDPTSCVETVEPRG